MTRLLLIPHSTTAATGVRLGGRTTASLDDRGRAQARAAGRRIAPLAPSAVYASPVVRARETADLVAGELGCAVDTVEGLAEVDYGRWTDRPLAKVARTARWRVVQGLPSLVRFPEGETLRAMQARAVEATEALVAEHRRETIAAVSHADVIKAVTAFYLGLPLDLFGRLEVAPGSVSALRLGPGARPALVRFNDDGPWGSAEGEETSRG